MEYELVSTDLFTQWLTGLRDATARRRIVARLDRVAGDKSTQDKDIEAARILLTSLEAKE